MDYEKLLRGVTAFISPTKTVKLTRQRRYKKGDGAETMILTFGRPNYKEREFIKQCKKAKEPFPVKKTLLRFWPKKK